MSGTERTPAMSFNGGRLLQRRNDFGLKQEQLAIMIGGSQSQISRYESGQDNPSTEVLIGLADALDTTTDYLLDRTDEPGRPIFHVTDLDEDEHLLLRAFRAKSPEGRRQALRVLQAL